MMQEIFTALAALYFGTAAIYLGKLLYREPCIQGLGPEVAFVFYFIMAALGVVTTTVGVLT